MDQERTSKERLFSLQYSVEYGAELLEVRKLVDEEKATKAPNIASDVFVEAGENIPLHFIFADDLPKGGWDGIRLDSNEWTFLLSKEQWDEYIRLNRGRTVLPRKELLSMAIKGHRGLKLQMETQMPLPSKEEADRKRAMSISEMDHQGPGILPCIFCQEEYESLRVRLGELIWEQELNWA